MNNKVVLFLFFLPFVMAGCNSKFDKVKWRKGNKSSSNNPRWKMKDDLRENYLYKGKSKSDEINDLLGTPYFSQFDSVTNELKYKYQLGSNQGLNIDEWYLNLTFDSSSILKDVEIAKH